MVNIPKFEPNIPEGSLQYSVFRFFTIVMLLMMMFGLIMNVKEVRINRENGYKNRVVVCSILKTQVMDKDVGSDDPTIMETYKRECAENPQLRKVAPNASW